MDKGTSRNEKSGEEVEELWNAIVESQANGASVALLGDLRAHCEAEVLPAGRASPQVALPS